ncbi:hypothetical protein V5799_013949 [Amblyomma americanum]|uniref:Uncharacterized protein n=1 Tax=Amblyomma americanum TaxID=6943 RepID=A0AAQ4E4G5_AMBAM
MRAPTPIEDVSLCDCVAGFPFTGCSSAFLEDADAHFGCAPTHMLMLRWKNLGHWKNCTEEFFFSLFFASSASKERT